jgi:hypothetical protein
MFELIHSENTNIVHVYLPLTLNLTSKLKCYDAYGVDHM